MTSALSTQALASFIPYTCHYEIAKTVGQYLGEDEEYQLDKQQAVHRQIFVMDESPLPLSSQELMLGLGSFNWEMLIDKEHHQYGSLCYDTGAHRSGWNLIEPGFISNGLKALKHAAEKGTSEARLPLYKDIHRIACAHFPKDPIEKSTFYHSGMCMTATQAGKFEKSSYHPLQNWYLFRAFPKSIQGALGYRIDGFSLPEKMRKAQLIDTEKEKAPARIDAINAYITKRSAELGFKPIAKLVMKEEDCICWFQVENEEEFTKAVFKAFNVHMAHSLSKAERIRACADLFQLLEWGHVFLDGQGRTDLIFLYTMLAQWGLNPPILEFPYVSMTSCLNEWEDQLIDGMIAWQKRYLEVRGCKK